ncbi:hypothetical protein E6O75_ATG05408 [Venturia nashicola]|uniref:Uncharacterized protein n=1 Tax=Venturia nashicola TaxID=86259 RepID=A0A4Z1PGB6_9PEZI|nr:hypothetical protein E6O75_ATG05408 [Venturia nashicola]
MKFSLVTIVLALATASMALPNNNMMAPDAVQVTSKSNVGGLGEVKAKTSSVNISIQASHCQCPCSGQKLGSAGKWKDVVLLNF